MSEEIKGWKLVPVEPTEEMLVAGAGSGESFKLLSMAIYTTMIEKAPEPSASVGMEPVAEAIAVGQYEFPHLQWKSVNHSLSVKLATDLYTAEQLANAVAAERTKWHKHINQDALIIEDGCQREYALQATLEQLRASNEALVAESRKCSNAMVAAEARIVELYSALESGFAQDRFDALNAPRDNLIALAERDAKRDKDVMNKLAAWMTAHGISTGHGDTIDDLLAELEDHDNEIIAKYEMQK